MNNQYKSSNMDDIYRALVSDLMENPDFLTTNRKGETLIELVEPVFVLNDPSDCFVLCRNPSFKYLKGELEFYLSGSPYLKDIVKYSKFWNKVSDDGLTINSNYGRLLLFDRNGHNYTQFEYAKSCLKNNPDSKKAVMVIYSKEHARKSNDNPCTMYLQFFLREGKLHLSVHMRSSDVWFGLPYDVPFFCLILFKMAQELNVEVGTYMHNAGSLHMYSRNRVSLYYALEKPVVEEERKIKTSALFEEIMAPHLKKE